MSFIFALAGAAQTAMALTLAGALAGWCARSRLAGSVAFWRAMAWLAACAAGTGLWLLAAMPREKIDLITLIGPAQTGWLWMSACRLASLSLAVQSLLLLCTGVVEATALHGWRGLRRSTLKLTPLTLTALAISLGVALPANGWGWSVGALRSTDSARNPAMLLSILVLLTLNAGLLTVALRVRRWRSVLALLLALGITFVTVPVVMGLFFRLVVAAGLSSFLRDGLWGMPMRIEGWLSPVAAQFTQSYLAALACLALGAWFGGNRAPAPLAPPRASRTPASTPPRRRTDPVVTRDSQPIVLADQAAGALRPGHYAAAAATLSLLAFYASLVPVNFTALPWREALVRFSQIKYYDLDITRRSDLMANFMLFIPLGYLALGATEAGGRRSAALRLITVPTVLAALAVWSIAIELAQVWFPPRTVSLNDLFAQMIGGAGGAMLWMVLGRWVHRRLSLVLSHWHSAASRQRLGQLYLLFILFYSLLPLDFTIDSAELTRKWQTMSLWTGADGASWLTIATGLVKNTVAFLPVGVVLLMGYPAAARGGPGAGAAALATVLVLILETIQFFIYSGVCSVLGAGASLLGALLGITLAQRRMSEEGTLPSAPRPLPAAALLGYAAIWLVYLAALLAVLWHPLRFDLSAQNLRQGWDTFLNWPFRSYYYSGEWQALNKVTLCMVLFAPVGVLVRWISGEERKFRRGVAVAALATALLGLTIELGQSGVVRREVYVNPEQAVRGRPLVADDLSTLHQSIDVTSPTLSKGMTLREGATPDLTDLLAYILGGIAGYLAADLFLTRRVDAAVASPARVT